jgi:basic membrane protein A
MVAAKAVVGALFAGRIDDGGFMESGYRALIQAAADFGLSTTYTQGIAPQPQALIEALRALAHNGAAMVIAHGGQNDAAARAVASEFARTAFVVTQGSVCAPNLSSFEVCQEQSAFLAGVAAARLTRTGVVGHMSGIRVRPGLLGRAAYVAGVTAENPETRILTTFCGTQEDVMRARKVAELQIGAGADVIFTMLNTAVTGVTAACRDLGAKQIGNVRDWVAIDPEVFVGAAIADVGAGVYESCAAYAQGYWQGGQIRRVGVENPQAVRMRLSAAAPPEVVAAVANWCSMLSAGRVVIPAEFDGAEFAA